MSDRQELARQVLAACEERGIMLATALMYALSYACYLGLAWRVRPEKREET
ncbi:MAG: hypothetical protein J0I08_23600 [Rhizobiales bacterium]|nr:hypothetical protein [Hyphomicrobiales bacterium]